MQGQIHLAWTLGPAMNVSPAAVPQSAVVQSHKGSSDSTVTDVRNHDAASRLLAVRLQQQFPCDLAGGAARVAATLVLPGLRAWA